MIAIALLGLQMFTICGHVILYQYFIYQSDKVSNDRIDNNMYNIHDLVEVKIPAHTAITQSWAEYELVSGQIQFKNTCYNYVKLKLTADTIYLVCIPNYEKTRLFNQNIINAKAIDDAPLAKKEHIPFGKNIDLGKYNYTVASFTFAPPVISLQTHKNTVSLSPVEYHIAIPHRPPERFC